MQFYGGRGVGYRGKKLARRWRDMPGVRAIAVCMMTVYNAKHATPNTGTCQAR